MSNADETDRPESSVPSKSQRKREAHALQNLGEQLVALPAAQLDALDLPETVYEAVRFARSLDARGARKRQLKFIARLLREADGDAIRATVDILHGRDRHDAARFRHLETLREQLISAGDAALAEFIASHPHADRQQLRQLIRQARLEREQNRPPHRARALFRLLRELSEGG